MIVIHHPVSFDLMSDDILISRLKLDKVWFVGWEIVKFEFTHSRFTSIWLTLFSIYLGPALHWNILIETTIICKLNIYKIYIYEILTFQQNSTNLYLNCQGTFWFANHQIKLTGHQIFPLFFTFTFIYYITYWQNHTF